MGKGKGFKTWYIRCATKINILLKSVENLLGGVESMEEIKHNIVTNWSRLWDQSNCKDDLST